MHPSLSVSSWTPVRSGQNTEQNRVTAEGLFRGFFQDPSVQQVGIDISLLENGAFYKSFPCRERGASAARSNSLSQRCHLSFICFGRLIAIVRRTGDCFDVACQWVFSRTNGLIVDTDWMKCLICFVWAASAGWFSFVFVLLFDVSVFDGFLCFRPDWAFQLTAPNMTGIALLIL